MSLSDCPKCWNHICTCEEGYLGSKNYQYEEIIKDLQTLLDKISIAPSMYEMHIIASLKQILKKHTPKE